MSKEGCLPYGLITLAGRRRSLEDAVKVAPGLIGEYDFFAVYDGHGGDFVAKRCKERLYMLIADEVTKENGCDWKRVMTSSFEKMDEELRKSGGADIVGSTATIVMVGKDDIVVANCGDSRAVLCHAGSAMPISIDHKPNRPDERERVEAAGGRIFDVNGNLLVMGVLATSRSIGDVDLKPYVIPEPAVSVYKLTEQDDFVIIANAGLWNALSNETACEVVKMSLAGPLTERPSVEASENCLSGEDPERVNEPPVAKAAILLAELAIARGSKENISIIVVQLLTPVMLLILFEKNSCPELCIISDRRPPEICKKNSSGMP